MWSCVVDNCHCGRFYHWRTSERHLYVSLVTARIRRMRMVFLLCSPLRGGGEAPPTQPEQDGRMGYSPGQDRMGYPPSQDRMGYLPHPPQTEQQHSVYLLRGGRYARYVHAGGLSCLIIVHKFSASRWPKYLGRTSHKQQINQGLLATLSKFSIILSIRLKKLLFPNQTFNYALYCNVYEFII